LTQSGSLWANRFHDNPSIDGFLCTRRRVVLFATQRNTQPKDGLISSLRKTRIL
jgi:hypothetical protein